MLCLSPTRAPLVVGQAVFPQNNLASLGERLVEAMSDELERISEENELCRRIRKIPGFGPLVSTATVAAIGNGAAFGCGRDFAAWVGVVPR